MTIAYEAMLFAKKAHEGQKRKYTGNPYFDHCCEVAGIVSTVASGATVGGSNGAGGGCASSAGSDMIATAFLHDVMEDCDVRYDDVRRRFGGTIAYGVFMLSDLEEGNRKQRKEKSRARVSSARGWVQTIKCADLISNTSSIIEHDPKFAGVYLQEKASLLDVMTRADVRLLTIAHQQVQDGLMKINGPVV
ncbi:MAG: guanosine polyphosphate pyrophosphohydrolase [Pusillimonas sp.]|nr:guanosine polyphosphate pyrophosphohydrolase [Pusillimonas sp.]|tara:strand:+ start:1348 stop:1920 length:573 start_codon:yes stop_codon:yes gene_type:complete